MTLAGILLAAGSGRRFGANKLLAPLPDGIPMAVAAGRTLRLVLPRTVAVVRREDRILAQLLAREGLEVVPCAAAVHGMGASLAEGVRASAGADGWLVALGDMPCLHRESIAGVVRCLTSGAAIAAPVHRGRRGHPVGFSARFREALLAMSGDQGARALLMRHSDLLVGFECADGGVLLDVDRPEDLAQLRGRPVE